MSKMIGRNDPCPCGSKKPNGLSVKYKKCCMQKDQALPLNTNSHIHLDDLRIDGIAAKNMLVGEKAFVLVRAEITSDEPEFYPYIKNLSNLLSGRMQNAGMHLSLDRISAFLLITHDDGSADLYIQDIPLEIEVLAKHGINAGEVVYRSGIADVRRIRMPGILIKPTDGIIFCFKVGWKFALFFDLGHDRTLDMDAMERSLGSLYRRLSFEDAYTALGDPVLFDKLTKAGWFPFIEVIGGEFEKLLEAHMANFNIQGEEESLLKKFDNNRINSLGDRWWKRPCLQSRQHILQPALEAFKRGDSVSCLKIILTEIEGIIQDMHIADVGAGAGIQDLLKYVVNKGAAKVNDQKSLFFSDEFLKYLRDYTFASFDPKTPKNGVMSRHSAGHGRATPEAYTQTRALQAILTLDQISFYL